MGKWSKYDSDRERLPSGMRRIAYDADTQVYTYRDRDGSLWEGAPGSTYGTLWPVRDQAPRLPSVTVENPSGEEKDPPPLPDDAYEFLMTSDRRQRERKADAEDEDEAEGEMDDEKRPRSRYKPRPGSVTVTETQTLERRKSTLSGFAQL